MPQQSTRLVRLVAAKRAPAFPAHVLETILEATSSRKVDIIQTGRAGARAVSIVEQAHASGHEDAVCPTSAKETIPTL